MNHEHAEILTCTFGGAIIGSMAGGNTGAIIGAIIGLIISIRSIRNDRNNLAG